MEMARREAWERRGIIDPTSADLIMELDAKRRARHMSWSEQFRDAADKRSEKLIVIEETEWKRLDVLARQMSTVSMLEAIDSPVCCKWPIEFPSIENTHLRIDYLERRVRELESIQVPTAAPAPAPAPTPDLAPIAPKRRSTSLLDNALIGSFWESERVDPGSMYNPFRKVSAEEVRVESTVRDQSILITDMRMSEFVTKTELPPILERSGTEASEEERESLLGSIRKIDVDETALLALAVSCDSIKFD